MVTLIADNRQPLHYTDRPTMIDEIVVWYLGDDSIWQTPYARRSPKQHRALHNATHLCRGIDTGNERTAANHSMMLGITITE